LYSKSCCIPAFLEKEAFSAFLSFMSENSRYHFITYTPINHFKI
jgi:hypothetical protein